MNDLVAFLRARLDEQEESHAADWWQECKVCREPAPCWFERDADAKRRIIEEGDDRYDGADEYWRVLTLLALPYVGHPEYREEWRP